MNRYLKFLVAFLSALFFARAEEHWAWQPIRESTGDEPSIDTFVDSKLRERNLTRTPEADRRILIRRLSYDLHGLPPSPDAIAKFVNDRDPEAYEKLVDRILDSPHYGERMAQHWLDLAHYADTHGFERDLRRPHAWRYRDYVIASFNADKPFVRFLQEQIAGDTLWPENREAITATGFLAAGPWDFVGQVETKSPILRRAARSLDLDDMLTQVMTSTMALTINCARCHDHKIDPISQEDYYRMRAVFAGTKRAARDLPKGAQESLLARRTEIRKEIQALAPGISLADVVGGGDGLGSGKAGFAVDPRTGMAESKRLGFLPNVKPNVFSPSANALIDGVFVPSGEGGKGTIPISSTGLTLSGIKAGDGKAWDLIRNGPVNGQHSPKLGGVTFGEGGEPLLGLHANAGITFDLEKVRERLGGAALKFTARIGYFGQKQQNYFADARVLFDGKVAQEHLELGRKAGLQTIDLDVPKAARFLTLLSTDGGNGISHDQIGYGSPHLFLVREESVEMRQRLAALRAEFAELNAQLADLAHAKVFAVVSEAKVPETRLLERGDSESPVGDPLAPRMLPLLGRLNVEAGGSSLSDRERRVVLVKWIVDPRNPLPARVIANRLWHWHLGVGLVATPSDFGLGGAKPSHPELLDYLALILKNSDWSLKAVQREILLSATYRQDSRFAEDARAVAVDARNRFLWRQNARRLDAESLRDAVLAVSGKLNRKRGGPGFEDFSYREAYAPEYTYITADRPELWRRTIYRYVVRTTPNRFLTTLDCPDPANFTPVRMTTTTPLQALALLNNEFMLRQARYFAERLATERPDIPGQIKSGYLRAFGRSPTDDEVLAATAFVNAAGLEALCRALLNANEFVYVD